MKSIARLFASLLLVGLFSLQPALPQTPPQDQSPMQQALEALKQARHRLEQAIPDKEGHRAAAIKACDEAIKHAEESIKWSSEHHEHDK